MEFHPSAIEEAVAARVWYEERSTLAATAFLRELDQAIDQVSRTPKRFPRYVETTRRYLFRRFPFALIYEKADRGILVLAGAHCHRKPGFWRVRGDEE